MKTAPTDYTSHAPDLLKRFVPLPFEGAFAISDVDVWIKTNDPAILELLTPFLAQPRQNQTEFKWSLIRDSEAPLEIERLTIVKCGRLAVANLGPACLIGVDYDRRELVAFLGLDPRASKLRDIVLPLLTTLTVETSFKLSKSESAFAAGALYE